MFRHPAWAVGSYSSGPAAARALWTKSTGGFYHSDDSPCSTGGLEQIMFPVQEFERFSFRSSCHQPRPIIHHQTDWVRRHRDPGKAQTSKRRSSARFWWDDQTFNFIHKLALELSTFFIIFFLAIEIDQSPWSQWWVGGSGASFVENIQHYKTRCPRKCPCDRTWTRRWLRTVPELSMHPKSLAK